MSDFSAESEAIRNEVPVERELNGTHRRLRFTVGTRRPPTGRGWRLDRYLHALLPTISRSLIQRWIQRGCATVDGDQAGAGDLLRPGQRVELRAPLPEREPGEPEPPPLSILYHDSWLLVADKPAGQLAHQAGRTMTGTLLNQARDWLEAQGCDGQAARLVNRIDRDTSGTVLISLDLDAHVALSAAIEARDVYKQYQAICVGVPEPTTGSWRDPIGPGPETSIARVVRADGQACHTDYEVMASAGEGSGTGHALLRIQLHTGRQHQIRVHAAHHGHALVGDWVYGQACTELGGQALHAAVLGFPHPRSGKTLRVEAPLPEPLRALWARLEAGAQLTPCELTPQQRSKLSITTSSAQVRRPSWLSADEFASLRDEAGE